MGLNVRLPYVQFTASTGSSSYRRRIPLAVVTGPVRSPLEAVHDRRPLILEPAAIAAWLDGCQVEGLPRLPMAGLAWQEVSHAVSSVRNNGPEQIEPVTALDET